MSYRILFDTINSLNDKYLDIWEDVCNIESPTDSKEGVDSVNDCFIALAKERGWLVERKAMKTAGDVVCITMNPDSKLPPVTFSGHTDTVHPIGLFGNPPCRRDEKYIYGPGVMDCKGGIVASFLAMDALSKTGFTKRPLKLLLQSDEEQSSRPSNKATIDFMCEKAKGSAVFFNCEGSKAGTLALTRKGILFSRVTITGKAVHAARCQDGASAIVEAAHKIIELEKLKNGEGLTCNCGLINGGSAPNSVPSSCFFTVDMRFSTNEELEEGRKLLRNICATTFVEGTETLLEEISMRPAMVSCERNTKLFERMNEIYTEAGMTPLTARRCPSGSDAAYITEAGIPCVDCIGVEGNFIHSIKEHALLSSLAESAKRMAVVALKI
ncbi:MAG: M20/M25/M40 family metallo-hydrolase [Oscillospiraceae bacterium]|nr:M20/M25/M40 family metallo-hydrolase [Oscillospiraceae bacterium]